MCFDGSVVIALQWDQNGIQTAGDDDDDDALAGNGAAAAAAISQ